MHALGTHLLLELRDCNEKLLDDLQYIQETMITAADKAGATIVGQTFHKFSPQGVTGVVAVAESHLCIHTWPEYEYAAVDIFTCGKTLKPRQAAQYLIERLHCTRPEITELKRGLLANPAKAKIS